MFLKFHISDNTKVLVSHRNGFTNPRMVDVVHEGDIKTFNKFRQNLSQGDFWLNLLSEGEGLNINIPVTFRNHQMEFPLGNMPPTAKV